MTALPSGTDAPRKASEHETSSKSPRRRRGTLVGEFNEMLLVSVVLQPQVGAPFFYCRRASKKLVSPKNLFDSSLLACWLIESWASQLALDKLCLDSAMIA